MLEQFRTHINLKFPFLKGKKLIVAVSGGADSIVLAHLLHQLEFPMVLAHCNFKLRDTESNEDEAFVIRFGKKLSLEVYSRDFDVKTHAENHKSSIQMSARALRYEWFDTLLHNLKYDFVLTAHHADDNLETFLINLSRGSGLTGLCGIPEHNKHIIRPLLPFSKADILSYANENKLLWREDSSNASVKYLRNRIRHSIVPELKKLHPYFPGNFRKTLQHLSGSKAILQQHIAVYQKTLFRKEDNTFKIAVAELKALSPQKPYLYELFKDFGFREWNDVAHMLDAPSGKQLFSATHRLLKDRDYMYLEALPKNNSNTEVLIQEETQSISRPLALSINKANGVANSDPNTIYVDKEKLKFPLSLRKWKKGDYFYPFGMQGKKKLSKFFKDEKYSLRDKEKQWLLCSEDNIVWVIGKRADNRYKIAHNTENILKIKVQQ